MVARNSAAATVSRSGVPGGSSKVMVVWDRSLAGMKVVAGALQMNDRTLRRRLADEGTSFSEIAHQVKYRVATQHLKASDATVEQVAQIAGFSDAANFRRAFLRWTSMTPAQFRRAQHR